MKEYPFFPMFVNLSGQKCLVVGGGHVATRKCLTMLTFGAKIRVISPALSEELQQLAKEGKLEWFKRKYIAGDESGMALVVAATNDEKINRRIAKRCQMLHISINVAAGSEGSFIFPAVSVCNKTVAGISTSGENPAVSAYIRKKIDQHLAGWEKEGRDQYGRDCQDRHEEEPPGYDPKPDDGFPD